MRRSPYLLLSGLLVSSVAAGTQLEFERCLLTSGARSIDAQCATLTRPENPDAPDGKTVDLFVAKVPSRSPNPEPEALTLIQGGPGGSSIDLYVLLGSAFEGIRQNRDILLVDQRGTGRSNKLACPMPDDEQVLHLDPALARTLATECLSTLASDPRFYTTSIAVQDLDAVRAAAGYEQLDIYGVSYGTRVAQHYLRRFPERVRTMVIDGVVPADWILAGDIARFSQAAFDKMAARCREDSACTAHFGDLKRKFGELRERLATGPIEVSLPHPATGEPLTETLAEGHLLTVARMLAYSTEQLALVPLLIDQAHAGNYAPLAAQVLRVSEDMSETFATGMHNTVVCTEDMPFVESGERAGLEQTYLGAAMFDALQATCEVWPHGPIDDDFKEPLRSDRPVLILSGMTDPVTPSSNGDAAEAMLSNRLHIKVPGHGHGVISRGCVPQLVSQFVKEGTLDNIDATCVQREGPLPFFFDFSGPQP